MDDFFVVHRKKVADWKHDDRFCKYLRPATLYVTKLDSYKNQRDPPNRVLSDAGMKTAEMLKDLELD